MSDTPRTDRVMKNCNGWHHVPIEHARQLERELNAANARLSHITDGFRREQNDIEQTCGKALGYPRFCDDQKNFPGSTEADGVIIGDHVAASIVAELANKYAAAMERIKWLEEAGQALFENSYPTIWDTSKTSAQKLSDQSRWVEAKEAKL